eukprot:GHVO01012584.1.p1 GENE.GHVO01012584.1~~GHVO01012584.1.p1  ORF type:complete len:587 (-),score=77.80 GHVO01012584.1:128-1783(-)
MYTHDIFDINMVATATSAIAISPLYASRTHGFLPLPAWAISDLSRYTMDMSLSLRGLTTSRSPIFESVEYFDNIESDIVSSLTRQAEAYNNASKADENFMTFPEYLGTTSYLEVVLAFDPNYQYGDIKLQRLMSFEQYIYDADVHNITSISKDHLLVADIFTKYESARSSFTPEFVAIFFQNLERVISSSIRVQGSTAYFTRTVGGDLPLGNDIQARTLETWINMINSGFASNTYEELAQVQTKIGVYLSQGGATMPTPFFDVCPPFPGDEMDRVGYALSALDSIGGNMDPDVELVVNVRVEGEGITEIFNEHLNSANPGPINKKLDWIEYPLNYSDDGYIQVSSVGYGIGTSLITLGMDFVSNAVETNSTYQGIRVEKKYMYYNTLTKSCEESSRCCSNKFGVIYVERMSTVCVVITVTVKDQLEDISIADNLPSGLEPIFNPDRYEEPIVVPYAYGSMGCSETPSSVNEADGQVAFYCAYMYPGTHQFMYKATANIPGLFSIPPTIATSRIHAGVMGSTGNVQTGFYIDTEKEYPTEFNEFFIKNSCEE